MSRSRRSRASRPDPEVVRRRVAELHERMRELPRFDPRDSAPYLEDHTGSLGYRLEINKGGSVRLGWRPSVHPLDALLELTILRDRLEMLEGFYVAGARLAGLDWQTIASCLGQSRPTVARRWAPEVDEWVRELREELGDRLAVPGALRRAERVYASSAGPVGAPRVGRS